MSETKSLQQIYPRHFWLIILMAANAVLFYFGLVIPVLKIRQLGLFTDTFSIMLGIQVLFTENQRILAIVIFIFSVIFPASKLLVLAAVWLVPFEEALREKLLHLLEFLGKWSMTDVFVISITIVAAKLSGFANAEALTGIYIFGMAVLMSMLLSFYVGYLTRK